jgi:hypothetical protein
MIKSYAYAWHPLKTHQCMSEIVSTYGCAHLYLALPVTYLHGLLVAEIGQCEKSVLLDGWFAGNDRDRSNYAEQCCRNADLRLL